MLMRRRDDDVSILKYEIDSEEWKFSTRKPKAKQNETTNKISKRQTEEVLHVLYNWVECSSCIVSL
jgi:hypothetical protein